jgi:hypothetical protein
MGGAVSTPPIRLHGVVLRGSTRKTFTFTFYLLVTCSLIERPSLVFVAQSQLASRDPMQHIECSVRDRPFCLFVCYVTILYPLLLDINRISLFPFQCLPIRKVEERKDSLTVQQEAPKPVRTMSVTYDTHCISYIRCFQCPSPPFMSMRHSSLFCVL